MKKTIIKIMALILVALPLLSASSYAKTFTIYNEKVLNEKTIDNPTGACLKDPYRCFYAWTGTDKRICIAPLNGSKKVLNEYSNNAPSLTRVENTLFLAFTGTDGRINIVSSTDGTNFGNKIVLNDTSKLAPSICYDYNFKVFCVAWTGTDGRINFMVSKDLGKTWFDKEVLDRKSDFRPAVAAEIAQSPYGDCIRLAFTDSASKDVYIYTYMTQYGTTNLSFSYMYSVSAIDAPYISQTDEAAEIFYVNKYNRIRSYRINSHLDMTLDNFSPSKVPVQLFYNNDNVVFMYKQDDNSIKYFEVSASDLNNSYYRLGENL